jgi:hypothetical protein
MVADMDNTPNAYSTIDAMNSLTNDYDIFLHDGDFAYNIEDANGMRGDNFFDAVQPAISSKPYLITPGNHENIDKGQMLNYRFRMPGQANDNFPYRNHWFSFDVQNIHFTSINIDWYIKLNPTDPAAAREQLLDWLESDMRKSSKINYKYRILFTHRPVFCGQPNESTDCSFFFYLNKPIEDLLMKYKYDLVLQAHLHDYTRLWKTFSFVRLRSSSLDLGKYDGPAYVISGHSGTVHYFPEVQKPSHMSELNQRYITGKDANFLHIEIDDEKISVLLKDSVTREVEDEFIVFHNSQYEVTPKGVDLGKRLDSLYKDRNFWVGAFWCLVVFLVIFCGGNVLAYFWIRRRTTDGASLLSPSG